MASPTIHNVNQAWLNGATWLNTYLGNEYSQETDIFQNNSGTTLYTGDVVIVGNSTSGSFVADPTALGATTTTTASSPLVLGVVGGEVYNPGSSTLTPASVGGELIPPQVAPTSFDSCTTNGTATVTDANAKAYYVGMAVVGTGIPSGAYIISVTVNTSFVMNVSATNSATNTLAIQPQTGQVGPGFPGISGYGAGTSLPVVTMGWAYVNIGTNTVAANGQLATSATSRVAATPATAASVAALQALAGSFIGIALEAQSAGIGSPDGTTNKLIRAWICKY